MRMRYERQTANCRKSKYEKCIHLPVCTEGGVVGTSNKTLKRSPQWTECFLKKLEYIGKGRD